MPQYPSKVSVKILQAPNPEYDPELAELYEALYLGGTAFEAIQDGVLIKRGIETHSDPASGFDGNLHYQARKKRSPYINYAGGLIDWFTASVFRDTVRIESANEYYASLNSDADGMGTSLPALLRKQLRDMLLHFRSYLTVSFDQEVVRERDDDADARLSVVSPMQLTDWQEDRDGFLEWVRVYTCEPVRGEGGIGPADTIRHYWTYVDREAMHVYLLEKDAAQRPTAGDMADLIETRPIGLGAVPFFDARPHRGQWVMDRIRSVIIGLYNAESDLQYNLSASAYAQPVLKIDDRSRLKTIMGSPLGAIMLLPGETFEYATPNTGVFGSLFENVERYKKATYEVVQAMAIHAATIPQAGRLSGDAIEGMRDPLHVLLASFASPIIDSLTRALDSIAYMRGDPEGVYTIEGVTPFESKMTDVEEQITGESIEVDPERDQDENIDTAEGEEGLNTSQDTVLNGAQVSAALEIVNNVATGMLPRESGIGMLMMFFNLSREESEAVMGSAGQGFVAADEKEDKEIEQTDEHGID